VSIHTKTEKQELFATHKKPALDAWVSRQATESSHVDDWSVFDDGSGMPDDSVVLEYESDASWLEQSEWLDEGSDVSPVPASFAAAASPLT